MDDFHSFESLYHFDKDHTYPPSQRDQISQFRRDLGGYLFFDKLLSSLKIEEGHSSNTNINTASASKSTPPKRASTRRAAAGSQSQQQQHHQSQHRLYPPASNNDLRELHRRIVEADAQEHWKLSALYYLLRDCGNGLSEFKWADEFAKKQYLPEKYRVCVEGLWMMDRLMLKQALHCLTLPTLLPTFPEDVLHVLLTHGASAEEMRILPFAFYQAVQPPLTSDLLLDEYYRYLCTLSVTYALSFLRSRPAHTRQELFEIMITSVLTEERGEARARRAVEMLDLPLTDEETRWFEHFLLDGEGRRLHGAKDTVMVRRMASGRLGESEDLGKHLSGRKFDGLSWDDVKGGLDNAVGERGDGFGVVFDVERC